MLAVFCAGVAYGFIADRQRLFPFGVIRSLYLKAAETGVVDARPGTWNPIRPGRPERGLSDAEREDLDRLGTLGYLTGVTPAGEYAGVTVHDATLSYDGLNLLSSGHGPEAWLMDMDGEVLHSWVCDFRSVWPDWEEARGQSSAEHFGYVHLYEDGGLLAIFDWYGLVRLDSGSNVLWSYAGRSHHDVFVTEDGTIYALDLEDRTTPWMGEDRSIADNLVTVLSADGEVRRRVSIFEALARSDYAPTLGRVHGEWDVLHTNTVEVLDGRFEHVLPAFRSGNVLLSFRALDAIAVLDLEAESIVWALSGKWRRQHHPTFLENGRMLVFNNIAGHEVSEVLEFDPLTHEVFWSCKGDSAAPFYTLDQGRNQRLPNGNTLITESSNGRAFEVTPENTIVWEYVNPKRAGEDDELIASIPVIERLPRDFPLEWLKGDN
jgi:hypothetical protein